MTARLGAQGPLNHRWRGDDISYRAVHQRLRRMRGEASEHPCADCGGSAVQWAYTYQPDEPYRPLAFSTDLTRYRPLCAPCHTAYDRPRRPPAGTPLAVRAYAVEQVSGGRTQTDVASELGVTQAAVSKWIRHARANPRKA